MKTVIHHISDTHCLAASLKLPDNIDILIHSGDASNSKMKFANEVEMLDFLNWYEKAPAKYKIFVAGNHDTSVEKNLITRKDFESAGIIYLENSSTEVLGFNIFGTPVTPSYGEGWAFNKKRDKMHEIWDKVPEDTDIIISHGPPKGILDLSLDRDNRLEQCGDLSFRKCTDRIKPKLVCFGHIHNHKGCLNSGYTKLSDMDTIFSNGTCVVDGKFDLGLTSYGNTFEL